MHSSPHAKSAMAACAMCHWRSPNAINRPSASHNDSTLMGSLTRQAHHVGRAPQPYSAARFALVGLPERLCSGSRDLK
jgi:hypothetical protein